MVDLCFFPNFDLNFDLNDSFLLVVDCGNSKTFIDKGLILCLAYLNKKKQKPRFKLVLVFDFTIVIKRYITVTVVLWKVVG